MLFVILTFGAKRASDSIYREAAKGHHEVESLFILLFVISEILVVLTGTQAIVYITTMASDGPSLFLEECKNIQNHIEQYCGQFLRKER